VQWPTHLAEITELLGIRGWDESLAWYEEHATGLAVDTYSFSQ
jgi:hypothetical protein